MHGLANPKKKVEVLFGPPTQLYVSYKTKIHTRCYSTSLYSYCISGTLFNIVFLFFLQVSRLCDKERFLIRITDKSSQSKYLYFADQLHVSTKYGCHQAGYVNEEVTYYVKCVPQ